MSYDLRIYTIRKQNYKDLIEKYDLKFNIDGFTQELNNSQIFVSNEIEIQEEDIPSQISQQLPGIQYLIECNLSPYTDNKKKTSELLKLAKQIAQNGYGVIENPQTDDFILPSGVKRVLEIEKTERFSILELSWWFNNNFFKSRENISQLLLEIEKSLPEALPRRYGLYEPPKEKFVNIAEFTSYVSQNMSEGIVWYPSKPVIYVSLSVPPEIGPTDIGYRFGHFSIEIDSAVLSMPGWGITINRLFKNISQLLNPFYGDIHVFHNSIRKRTGAWSDSETESHPTSSWWWNGIPRISGLGLVIGEPLLEYVKTNREYLLLNNGCKLFYKYNDKEIYQDLDLNNDILQPEIKQYEGFRVSGFDERYPKIWPFEGPKI